MDKKDRNILIGAGALGLFLLLKGNKNSKLDSKFPTTEDSVTDRTGKNSPYYFGDKSDNAIYDPFYDYTDSEQLAIIEEANRGGAQLANYAVEKAFRVRIVPNSLAINVQYISSALAGIMVGCIVEIFNPFSHNLDPSYMTRLKDIYLSNLYLNNRRFDLTFLRGNDVDEGLIKYLNQYNSFEDVNPTTGRKFKYVNYLSGSRSLFIPQTLSFTPFLPSSYPHPIYRLSIPEAIHIWQETEQVTFDVTFQLHSSASCTTTVSIKKDPQDKTVYRYQSGKSICQSSQNAYYWQYGRVVKIYHRVEVKKHLLPYHVLPDNEEVKNGFNESLNILIFKGLGGTPNMFGDLNFS